MGWAVSTSPADWGVVGVAECAERRRERSVTVEKTGAKEGESLGCLEMKHFNVVKTLSFCGPIMFCECSPK